MEEYIVREGKRLRLGYTTGSCAAAAAKAAAWMLLTGRSLERIALTTPKGIRLDLMVREARLEENSVSCAIEKDSGDDPDVTGGTLIFATVSRAAAPGIQIEGGQGVGRVTKRGLDQPVGAAGRTPVPERESIRELARHQSTMVLFLSTGLTEKLQVELLAGGYPGDTPAAVVYKATWPDEKIFHCTVNTLHKTVTENHLTKTSLIIVGRCMGEAYLRSCLYDPAFATEFREAAK